MIAKMKTPLRRILLLWLILMPCTSEAKIKNVEIVYDKNEVYVGNTIRIALKITNHKGLEYFSTDSLAKYSFDNFNVYTSYQVEIIKKEATHIWVTINDNMPDKFTLNLEHKLGYPEIKTFIVPIRNFENEVSELLISKEGTLPTVQSYYKPKLTVQLKNGEQISVTNSAKINAHFFSYKVLSGGYYLPKRNEIYVSTEACSNNQLIIKSWVKSNPEIYTIDTIPVDKTIKRQLDYTPDNFDPNSPSGTINGKSGKNGPTIKVFVSMKKLLDSEEAVVNVQIKNEKEKIIDEFSLVPSSEVAYINVNGGNGQDGKNGKSGIDGKKGTYGNYGGFNGENGGHGENGGDGGNGGNGGNIIVYYSTAATPYLSQIVFQNHGGFGGKGGFGGRGGFGGKGGGGDTDESIGLNGLNGSSGQQGRRGNNGTPGRITYIAY